MSFNEKTDSTELIQLTQNYNDIYEAAFSKAIELLADRPQLQYETEEEGTPTIHFTSSSLEERASEMAHNVALLWLLREYAIG